MAADSRMMGNNMLLEGAMALDGLTLGFIARELEEPLLGGRVDKIQQPAKDMVVMHIRGAGQSHRLLINANPTGTRLHLTEKTYENPPAAPVFCMLMRKHLVGGRVTKLQQVAGDRLVLMEITGADDMGETRVKQLWFEAMGRHSNFSLVLEGRIIDSLRHVTDDMSRVRRMLPGADFVMPPGQDKLAPEGLEAETLRLRLQQEGGRMDRALQNSVSGLGMPSARELCLRLTGQEAPQVAHINLPLFCQQLAGWFDAMADMAAPHLLLDDQGVPKEALPFSFLSLPPERQVPYASLSQALDELHYQRDLAHRVMQRTTAFRRQLKAAEERTLRKLALQQQELDGAQRMEEYRVAGELLTAFAHQVQKGAEKASLPNYYDQGQPLEIALDPALSPAQNAQRYFKRYRKASTARRLAARQMANSREELRLIQDAQWALEQAQSTQDIQDIQQPLRDHGLLRRQKEQKGFRRPKASRPLNYRAADGTDILVGRNSLQNERLLKAAQGEDMWLHAKDMPGSHVIMQLKGRPPGEEALALAARLAAYYSKGEGYQVPVNYTLRKHVKKPGGAPAGFVTFSQEKLLVVNASLQDIQPHQVEES